MDINHTKNSYRQIMKATSIFGGVQVFNILISIGRSKILAILLGPAGVGILGLIMSTTKLISSLSNFGLGISAVKDISIAFESQDNVQLARTLKIVHRWFWFTGIIGAFITLVMAPILSELSFGNDEYTFAFVWLSITLLLNQLTSGAFVKLQALRRLNYLAKANMFGAAFGLTASIPLYYVLGVRGIVPSLIVTSILGFFVAIYFSSKIPNSKAEVSFQETLVKGKSMMLMGFMLSISGIMVLGVSYIIRIFINNTGGVDQVGLYNAGIAIISTYVGLLFTAMETDYYPRLSTIVHDYKKTVLLVNQQVEIAILILAPVLIVFLVYVEWILTILYSSEFIPIKEMIYWAALGMFFKVVGWVIGFIFIAKGASKLFFWNELISNFYMLVLNLIGYYYWGLTGLGYSFLLSYLFYSIQVYIIVRRKYDFKLSSLIIRVFSFQFVLALLAMLSMKVVKPPYHYIIGSIIIIISAYYSFIELDKRLNLRELIQKRLKK